MDQWACSFPFQRLVVSANGIILPCTGATNEEKNLVLGRYQGTPPKIIKGIDGKEEKIDVKESINFIFNFNPETSWLGTGKTSQLIVNKLKELL